jgi:hypothetical protein
MYSPLRQLFCVALSVLVLFGIVWLQSDERTGVQPDSAHRAETNTESAAGASGSWFDFLRIPALLGEIEEGRKRHAELIDERDGAVRRLLGKNRVVTDLSFGRLTLLEAARRFRDLNVASPNFAWDRFRKTYGGHSNEEHHCREVICRVRYMAPDLKGQPEVLVERLEAELRHHLARGTLHFPADEEQKSR